MAVGFPTKVNYATGDVLSATNMNDLSGTVNLLESAEASAAGVNKIINGDFGINQRAFTTTTTNGTFGFDRFLVVASDGTTTYSAQTFTPGTAPVAGYEATNFAQIVTTGQTLTTAQSALTQRIESVRTLAGQTTTFSFWAKANTGTPNVNVILAQNFGTGGSPSASVVTAGTVQAITTSWARYSFTIAVPSISGKTIGTTNDGYLTAQIAVSGGSASNTPTVGIQSNTFQIWGVQVEAGSTASDFKTATGTKQGELAACQRYYYRFQPTSAATNRFGYGFAVSASAGEVGFKFPVNMRTAPTALEQSGTAGDYGLKSGATNVTFTSVPTFNTADVTEGWIGTVTSGVLVAGNFACMRNTSTNAFLGWSAEL